MSRLLRGMLEKRKQYWIEQLIASGMYKKEEKHLFEWTTSELEKGYHFVRKTEK
ncbi:Fur-regulated basic protein FbpA [Ectobacillus ponti]|uniref:Fur-regulated basic protein FbpA n=1 Tax=Ectobacillus ponti TaxID=2961894 RepID=A0AA41X5W1_9BACI|nr:Fur-regulated basic protein FbpA [Ectobacillus ponti]MCP8967219.1 Fur-regulated basic protein FbpA [Ectobacillus ponti]